MNTVANTNSSTTNRSWHPDCSLWATAAEAMHQTYPPSLRLSSSSSLLPRDQAWSSSSLSFVSSSPSSSSTVPTTTGIPPILHYIWLGGPVSKRLRQLIESWRILHPRWLHYLWEDKDIEKLQQQQDKGFYNGSAFRQSLNLGQRSDILRYELLYSFGGVYVDMDMLGIGTLDTLCRESDFFIGTSNTTNSLFELNNAVIGSIPGHPLLRQLIEAIHQDYGRSILSVEPSTESVAATVLAIVSSSGSSSSLPVVKPASSSSGQKFMDVILRTGPWFITQQLMPTLLEVWGFTTRTKTLDHSSIANVDRMNKKDNDELSSASENLRILYPELLLCGTSSSSSSFSSSMEATIPSLIVPAMNGTRCRVLPKYIFYPLPNTIQIPPPEWTKDTDQENLQKLFYDGVIASTCGIIDNTVPTDTTNSSTHTLGCCSLCYWDRERQGWKARLQAEGVPSSSESVVSFMADSTKRWLSTIIGTEVILEHIHYGTIGIHYWSRLWQRKEAQLENTLT